MRDEIAMAARFVRDFRGLVQDPPTVADGRRRLAAAVAARSRTFMHTLEHGVFANPRSPYRPLLRRAGVTLPDVAGWVAAAGVEGALARLAAAEVYVTLDEFKGRAPIRRPGLEVPVEARAFDNPLPTPHFEAESGGSRGRQRRGARVRVSLELIAHEALSDLVFLDAIGARGRPMAVWWPVPPAVAGIKVLLRMARLGIRVERWFTQTPPGWRAGHWRYAGFTWLAVTLGRILGRPLPRPRHTPLDRADLVAAWLAERAARGTPAHLDATAGSAVRACQAAREHGLDIRGTIFRVGGEPLTPARARIVAEAGGRVFGHYNVSEPGRIGVACAAAEAPDDVHVALDKVAVIRRARAVGGTGPAVDAILCTTIHPASPKLLLNVELGDHAVFEERACGCPFDALGYRLHLHTIRSYEKLTSESMHFVGGDLLRLLEDVLPARFGGAPTDYQLVEAEEDGVARVSLVVSPRVGPVDESALLAVALEALGAGPDGHAMMAAYWRDAGTLRVVRREPYATGAGKILPLHLLGTRAGGAPPPAPTPRP